MSEQNDSPTPEQLELAYRLAQAYQEGQNRRHGRDPNARTETDAAHEANVQRHWQPALTAYLRRYVNVASEPSRYRRAHLTYTVHLPDDQHCGVIRFLAAHFDRTLPQLLTSIQSCGKKAVERKRREPGLWSLLTFPLILLFLLFTNGRDVIGTTPGLLMALALIPMIVLLMSARALRLRRLAKSIDDPAELLEQYCDVFAASRVQNASRPALAVCLALMLGAGGYTFYRSLPPSVDAQAVDTLTGYNSTVPTGPLDRLLMPDGRLADRKTLDSVAAAFPDGSDHALQFAIYLNQKVADGYPEGDARAALLRQIDALDLASFSDGTGQALLHAMLREIPWSAEPLYRRWLLTRDPADMRMAALVGDGLLQLSLDDRLALFADTLDGSQASGELLGAALTAEDRAHVRGLLDTVTDPDRLTVCARVCCAGRTALSEAVPILHRLRGAGIALKDVFPDGIRVALDLSSINAGREQWAEPPSGVHRCLILSRTERDEPFECFIQPPRTDYDANDKSNPDTFEVTLETALLDALPPKHFPATLDECDLLIVADMHFVHDADLHPETTGRYYPTYTRVYRLLTVTRDGARPVRELSTKRIAPGALLSLFAANAVQEEYLLSRQYLASDDPAWRSQAFAALLAALERVHWDPTALTPDDLLIPGAADPLT